MPDIACFQSLTKYVLFYVTVMYLFVYVEFVDMFLHFIGIHFGCFNGTLKDKKLQLIYLLSQNWH